VFTGGLDREKVIEESNYVYRNINKLKRKQSNAILHKKNIKNKNIRIAYNAALNSLNMLLCEIDNKLGIVSGFPKNYQFWTRDELIALKAFGKRKEVGEIYERILWNIQNDGWLPSRIPAIKHKCADGVGLFYKRYGKRTKAEEVINAVLENHTKDGFAVADDKETWMDTIVRKGVRIELQALRLNLYKLAGKKDLEHELKSKTIGSFWNKKYLHDGLDDPTIRPNIFLAHYYYPELLDKKDWLACIKTILPKLWCPWGGIATLDKRSTLFESKDKGERSYHNGNSWFYLNNIAAISMLAISKKEFKDKVKQIVNSSTEDILWHGLLGHCSEQSSFKKLESKSGLCQAWSAATFIELVNSL
jgi:glycogen debranching enzyme